MPDFNQFLLILWQVSCKCIWWMCFLCKLNSFSSICIWYIRCKWNIYQSCMVFIVIGHKWKSSHVYGIAHSYRNLNSNSHPELVIQMKEIFVILFCSKRKYYIANDNQFQFHIFTSEYRIIRIPIQCIRCIIATNWMHVTASISWDMMLLLLVCFFFSVRCSSRCYTYFCMLVTLDFMHVMLFSRHERLFDSSKRYQWWLVFRSIHFILAVFISFFVVLWCVFFHVAKILSFDKCIFVCAKNIALKEKRKCNHAKGENQSGKLIDTCN